MNEDTVFANCLVSHPPAPSLAVSPARYVRLSVFILVILATPPCAAATPASVCKQEGIVTTRTHNTNGDRDPDSDPFTPPQSQTPEPTSASNSAAKVKPDKRVALEQRFAEIMTEQAPFLFACVNRTLVSGLKSDVDDVVKETMLAGWSIVTADPDKLEELPKLLTGIALNKAITLNRRKNCHDSHRTKIALFKTPEVESPAVLVERKELLGLLSGALKQLDVLDPQAGLVAREVCATEGRPNFDEIGRKLDVPGPEAYNAWRRALRHCRGVFQQLGLLNDMDDGAHN
jgi:DNA-directed RNA polymerase specialized sigma24 family protein